ncbi:hypothetical protein Tco_0942898 [Tanacetum coccineum]
MKSHPQLPIRCPLCGLQPDSHSHLFFECLFSSKPMSRQRTAKSVIGRLILAATSYFIWIERNNRVFKKVKRSPEEIRDIIMVTVRLKLITFKFKNTAMVSTIIGYILIVSLVRLWHVTNVLVVVQAIS